MVRTGHWHDEQGGSSFRIFAPLKDAVAVVFEPDGTRLPLQRVEDGHWLGRTTRLPHGTRYRLEVDGRLLPDPASRAQPLGVHGPSMVVETRPAASPGWRGIAIEDAVIYELHLGSFTPEGTLAAAQAKLPHLRELGVNVIELLPVAAFPGERNWGYDGVFLFALHAAYGSYADLRAFLEAAHAQGLAVILDVVYNHFGPEGHYADALAPYTKQAATPWGAAVNFDGAWNHGVRGFFLDNARWWLEEIGFDGFRMDAVSLVFDLMPVHILEEITELARAIGREQGRSILTIAEHLRNNRFVTSPEGFGFDSQWNDDLGHALFCHLSGETSWRHHVNFGAFEAIVQCLERGFWLDGTRFDRYAHCYTGTDGRLTTPREHVVHLQNHDQVGNRPRGDRLIASQGRDKALLALTAMMASPFVPMLWMGEEWGETAPFYFFEDFSDPLIIDGCRNGRIAEIAAGGAEPPDPHARATFLASKLRWEGATTPAGRDILACYRGLIALKRRGDLGPREPGAVRVEADAGARRIVLTAPRTVTVLNFSPQPCALPFAPAAEPLLATAPVDAAGRLAPYSAAVFGRATGP